MAWIRLCTLVCLVSLGTSSQAEEEEIVDFSDLITPVCSIRGLTATPPEGWFNVPIDSEDKAVSGCQMMRTGDSQELVGIIRLLSIQLPPDVPDDKWFPVLVELERQLIEPMGYRLGEVLWVRDEVPVSGPGFKSASAVGFEASIEGNQIPQEVQFLGFDGQANRYILTLLTPGRTVEGGSFYQRNQSDFGKLIQTGLNRSP